jgi:hypothetical protein
MLAYISTLARVLLVQIGTSSVVQVQVLDKWGGTNGCLAAPWRQLVLAATFALPGQRRPIGMHVQYPLHTHFEGLTIVYSGHSPACHRLAVPA